MPLVSDRYAPKIEIVLVTRKLLGQLVRDKKGWRIPGYEKVFSSRRIIRTFIKNREGCLLTTFTAMLAGTINRVEIKGTVTL